MINERLELLRTCMQKHSIDAVIFPSNDPHQSEYVSDYWKVRAYFSGFTGSAGTLVISVSQAALWSDSRYFLQVEQQCADSNVQLHKQSIPHAPEHVAWICNSLDENAKLGIDYRLFSCSQIDFINEHASSRNIELVDIPHLVDEVWKERPNGGNSAIVDHPEKYCGESRVSKIDSIRTELQAENADAYFVSSLDEIAWLFNIRSKDVDYTPLVTGYAYIGLHTAFLFPDTDRVSEALLSTLKEEGVEINGYEEIISFLQTQSKETTVLTDASSLNYACFAAIQGTVNYKPSLIQHLKSIKNLVEISNAKDGMRKDGIALTRFFMWLEGHLVNNSISEYEIGRKLETFRQAQEVYTGQSFGCIVGYKGNGAIIHYSAPKEGSAIVKNEGMLLIDSGAQYENATTDITRTVWLGGTPSSEEKQAYTLVLKGYIELEQLQFPNSTVGMQLDSFARMHLWKHGLNYGHGTGHGIGSYSMVHEPGQGFASTGTTSRGTKTHEEHQFTTIEPGFYKEGAFGIRTENIVVSKIVQKTEFGTFLGFEPITLCYIDTQLLDHSILTPRELEWLNNYHQKVVEGLQDDLSSKELIWLQEKCQPI
ncbi:MAG: aminopeptidase P family protein [Crocinitomicaceae bacterium]|nr:aminopeptidase P family protein [Crocinitomicaceae bacterium]